MKFVRDDSGLFLCTNKSIKIFNLTAAYIRTSEEKSVKIPLADCDASRAVFRLPELYAGITVSIEGEEDVSAIKIKAEYEPRDFFSEKGNLHFYEEDAVGIELSPCDIDKATVIYRGSEWWARVCFLTDFGTLPQFTQSVIFSKEESNFFMSAFCNNGFKSNFKGGYEKNFSLYVYDNCLSNECDCVAALFSEGKCDFGNLIYKTVDFGFGLLGNDKSMREARRYPAILEYPGWCSWDAFHIDVSHKNLISVAKDFKKKGIPVKWFMIDDMWGEVKNNALGVNSTRELFSFSADKKRFPKGLKGVADELHGYGLQVGLWYPTTGYWNGLDPNGEIAHSEFNSLIFWSQEGQLVHRFEKDSIEKYYDLQNKIYSDCGINLIKVDNQACLRRFSKRVLKIGDAAVNLHSAIEKAADKYFDGQLINCMGMSIENFWNRKSAVIRSSCDFAPNDVTRFNLTIQQNAFNGLFSGCAYYCDYDMWWTYDSQSLKNAAAHSISGGPLYISDELGKTDFSVIAPMLHSDGTVIKMPQCAIPCDDCLFESAQTSGKPFKIYNKHGKNGVVVAYNISEDNTKVRGTVSPLDAGLNEDTRYCVYDVFGKELSVIAGEDILNINLDTQSDFKMYLFVAANNGSAIIGIKEKYVSFECVKDGRVIDDGTLVLYNMPCVTLNGVKTETKHIKDKFYELTVKGGDIVKCD